MAQRLVPNARDLWGYVTSQLRSLCSEGGAEPFVDEAAALGRTTRELHEALARATDRHAFTPARANHEDIVRWCSAIRHEVSDSIAVLERTDFGQALHPEKVSPARRDRSAGSREQIIAQALQDLEHRDVVLRDINALENDESLEVGLTIRHHGDYHLGQVLRDGSGAFYIIDFEGEPTRPLAERRALHSPLRDVAGMLRSFAYAAAMATLQCSQGTNALEWDVALHRAQTWQRHVREAFMQGYLSITSSVLPTDAATMEHLVRLFEIEKTFYELRYELAHRPDWVWVPMRGITEIVRESLRRGRRATGDAQPSPA